MSIKLHPRTTVVAKASNEMQRAVLDIGIKYDITYVEQMGIYAQMIAGDTKHALRHERHPNSIDKGADEA